MTSLRKQKAAISQLLLGRRMYRTPEDRLWDNVRPVGREFGGPDFDRLTDEDRRRNGVGVFDPAMNRVLAKVARR